MRKIQTLGNGRYKVSASEVLGEGSYAVVYKGLDVETLANVAVKVYKDCQDESTVSSFIQNIKVLNALCGGGSFSQPIDRRWSKESFQGKAVVDEMRRGSLGRQLEIDTADVALSTDPLLNCLDLKNCYVQILDHSKDSDGSPGKDSEGMLYLVMELGGESLSDWYDKLLKAGKTLSVEQLRDIQWALVSIVAGLHTNGYVHLDIKPSNIVRFKSQNGKEQRWKLIDLDGAVRSGEKIDLDNITLTPKYMPPEIAQTFGDAQREKDLLLSRRMDVWSVGMCALEAIFLQPILGPWYDQWQKETGSDDKFYLWLADFNTDPVLSGDMLDHLKAVDPEMCNLLQGMLEKDPQKRLCMASCWTHRWFQPIRDEAIAKLARAHRVAASPAAGERSMERQSSGGSRPESKVDSKDSNSKSPAKRTQSKNWRWSSGSRAKSKDNKDDEHGRRRGRTWSKNSAGSSDPSRSAICSVM